MQAVRLKQWKAWLSGSDGSDRRSHRVGGEDDVNALGFCFANNGKAAFCPSELLADGAQTRSCR